MDERLRRLHSALDEEEWQLLMRCTQGGARLPFAGPDLVDSVLASSSDQEIELFIKCQSILKEEPDAARTPAHEDVALVYIFDPDCAELDHFLGSLRRNGFESSTVEGAQAIVHVWLGAATDLEYFRRKETVRSLYDFARTARGRNPKGHRLHAP